MPRNGNMRPSTLVQAVQQEIASSHSLSNWFGSVAAWSSTAVGSPISFLCAIIVIVGWGVTGPMFHYSDTWQLVINTGTTIITFLMVFLIQNTQNRDAKAIHLKLNELIHAVEPAHNELIDVEKLTDEELLRFDSYYEKLRAECARRLPAKKKPA